jgi:hypothetical protein
MSLGRETPSGVAITVLNIDSPLSEDVIKDIVADPNIISLKFIKV